MEVPNGKTGFELREHDVVQKPGIQEQVYALTGMDELTLEQQVAYEEAWTQHIEALRDANDGKLTYYDLANQYARELIHSRSDV